MEFSSIKLKSSEKLSNIICINCKKDLIYFSDLKIMFTAKQLRIYEFLEDHDECVKYESNEEHFQQLLDPHLDFELSVEKYIKTGMKTISYYVLNSRTIK